MLSYNYVVSSNLLNEVRYGLSNWVSAPKFPLLGSDVISTLGLQGLDLSDSAQTFGGFPGFDFSTNTSFTTVGLMKVGQTSSITQEITDNVSWVKDRHTFKFGADYQDLNYKTVNNFAYADDFGYFSFQGAFTGDSFADFLLGLPTVNYLVKTGPNVSQTSTHFSAYAQDEFQLTKKLTLSYGLRWELMPPFNEASNNIANFNQATGDVIIPDKTLTPSQEFRYSINDCSLSLGISPCTNLKTASEEGVPQNLRNTYWKNFDPRLSLAWRPLGDKFVLRAGYGVYTVQGVGALAYQITGIASTAFNVYSNGYNSNGSYLFQFPQAVPSSTSLVSDVGTEYFDEAMDIHFRDPATAQYSFTVEQELSHNWSARLSYVGDNSYRLPFSVDLDQTHASTKPYDHSTVPFVNFSELLSVENVAGQNYQALEAQATHRTGSGFYLQSTYTFAKNLTNANGDAPTQMGNEVGFVGAPVGFTDRFNTRSARGNDVATRRNRLLTTAVYDLPFGKNKRLLGSSSPLLRSIVSNWQLSSIALLQSGPFQTPTIAASYSQANINEAARGVTVRPDRIGSCRVAHPTKDHWFNEAAFVATPSGAGRLGNSGVGVCEGPGTIAISGGVARGFSISERMHGRFEATFTNLTNHTNLAAPNTLFIPSSDPSYSSSSFGQTTTAQSSENAGNRTGQLSFRLEF